MDREARRTPLGQRGEGETLLHPVSPQPSLLVPAPFPAAPGAAQPCRYTVLSTDRPGDLHRGPAGLSTSAATRASVRRFHKASNFGKGTERCPAPTSAVCEYVASHSKWHKARVPAQPPARTCNDLPPSPSPGEALLVKLDGRKGTGSFRDVLLCAWHG